MYSLSTLAWFFCFCFVVVVIVALCFLRQGLSLKLELTDLLARFTAQKAPGIHLLLLPLLWSCLKYHYTWIFTWLLENQTHEGILPTETSP